MEQQLLIQLQNWHEDDEYQQIIDTIEALPEDEQDVELIGQLARAYNNRGERGDYERAIELLMRIEQEGQEDPNWHFRLGYAYYYLDQESKAIAAFERVLELGEDEDAQEFIARCRQNLTYPVATQPFSVRVETFWQTFLEQEEALRHLLDQKEDLQPALKAMREVLGIAFADPYFEIGFNGTKYELIVTPEGQKHGLFKIKYWQEHAPEALREHWNFHVGRQAANMENTQLKMYDVELMDSEVQAWPEVLEGKQIGLTLYCDKWLPLLAENENAVYSMAAILIDQCIGEASAIVHISWLEIADVPQAGDAITLTQLRAFIAEQVDAVEEPLDPCEYFLSYQMEPEMAEDGWDLRQDVVVGNTACAQIINAYFNNDDRIMDEHQADGVIFGFLFYNNQEIDRSEIVNYRGAIEDELIDKAGEYGSIIGGATGQVYSYIDCVCYDLRQFLAVAHEVLNERSLQEIGFHVFRRSVGGINMKKREGLMPDDLKGFLQELSDEGRMGAILEVLDDFIASGVAEEDFTEEDAEHDLQIALWRAFAHSNFDEYEHYLEAARCLAQVEDKAAGCGTWYYRYAVALMYMGQLEESLRFAEQGVTEEPEYPWGWLHLAGLRSHFGDQAGALAAIDSGLALLPEDYEFLRRQQEILQGATLEEMENHFIDPEHDRQLADAELDAELMACKLAALAGILCAQTNLAAVKQALGAREWEADSPYCVCQMLYGNRELEVLLRMNEAAASKFDPAWISSFRGSLNKFDEKGQEWLEEASEGRLQPYRLMLNGVTLLYDRSFILSYQEKNTDDGSIWTVTFKADGEVNEREQSNYFPELYSPEEFDTVEAHINRCFGQYDGVMHELVSPDIHVDICIIAPTQERDYYTLVTCGAGAHHMNIPEDLEPQQWGRAELLITLPSDWDLHSSDENWYWPIRLLKSTARLPKWQDTWLGVNHTIGHEGNYAESTDFCGAILLSPQDGAEGAEACVLPNGDEVNFYQLFPLYQEELAYKLDNGGEALIETMAEVDHVVDVYRPNTHAGYQQGSQKNFLLSAEDILQLLDNWEGPDGCIATDRITVDGCKVGYMYREEPSEDNPADSGWRFVAGDESEDYMDDPHNSAIYALNTICNYDPDILPLLDFPYGTAFGRDSSGELRREELPQIDDDQWQ